MEEFAVVSGLSRPTMSKYFNDPNSVRASTRARIEAALERYDYRPNIFAINQNRKMTKNVGIVVPFLADPFFAEIARALEERCLELGFRPSLFSSHGEQEHELEILDNLRSLKPAGVLLAPLGRVSDKFKIAKFCDDVPTVLFDSFLPDIGLAFVGTSSPQMTQLIVDYLCRTGESPCFFEMKTPANPNADQRRQAYLEAVSALGLSAHVIQVPGEGWAFEEIGRREGARALANGSFKTNTVLCSNDRLAIGLLTACYEAGLDVGLKEGAQLRVAGQDDHPFSRYTCPPLTTVAQAYDAIARHSLDVLVAAVNGDRSVCETKLFEGRLVMRQSA